MEMIFIVCVLLPSFIIAASRPGPMPKPRRHDITYPIHPISQQRRAKR